MVLRRCKTKICFHCKDCTRKVYLCSCKVFISVAVIVLGRRFSVARTEHILRLEKSWYLLLHNICCPQEISIFTLTGACVNTGIAILVWLLLILCSLTCCLLVLYSFLLCLPMMRSLVLRKDLLEPKSLIKQEVLENVLLVLLIIFVFELRRCVGIRMCNSNTPINSSIILLHTSIRIRTARPHIDVLCVKPIMFVQVFVCLRMRIVTL